MHSEEHIGDRLTAFIQEKGWTKAELARLLGMSPQSLTAYFSGSTRPGKQLQDKLNKLGCNLKWLMYGGNEEEPTIIKEPKAIYKNKGVPFYGMDVTASILESFNDIVEKPEYYIDFKPLNDCTAFFQVFGDSMYPRYQNGDIIAVKHHKNKDVILWGEAYLVITTAEANNMRTLKLLFQHEDQDKIILRAVNPDYKGDTVVPKEYILNLFIVKGKVNISQM